MTIIRGGKQGSGKLSGGRNAVVYVKFNFLMDYFLILKTQRILLVERCQFLGCYLPEKECFYFGFAGALRYIILRKDKFLGRKKQPRNF